MNSFQVRRAEAGDEPVLRALRIQALSEAPEAFGSTLAREVARSPADWQRWLSPGATFILDTSTGPMGMVAGVPDNEDQAIVHLMAMWVHPELRGTGAADLLVDAVVIWGEGVGASALRLDVIAGNDRARQLDERHQFRPTGHTAERPRDGATEIQMTRPLGQSG
ncbi:MAG: GNAT family N-acetyltransferase [Gemmatimonadota bacterium]